MNGVSWFWSLLMGGGVALLALWWSDGVPTLEARIAPALRLPSSGSPNASTPGSVRYPRVERWLGPRLASGVRMVGRFGSAPSDLASRLRRSGVSLTVDQFRAEQVVWGIGGLAAGIALGFGLAASRGTSPLALGVLAASMAASGVAAREYALGRAVARREAGILAELPTIAEMLALAVNAGEGIGGALDRIGRIATGSLADELRAMVGAAKSGVPLGEALRELADATRVAELRRFADGIAIAVERGTPLADLLHSQANDIREAGRRRLMEEGGKREIAMMIPVVFLILPVTVIFAVFPGIVAINLGT
jgi:tight adherence protein C